MDDVSTVNKTSKSRKKKKRFDETVPDVQNEDVASTKKIKKSKSVKRLFDETVVLENEDVVRIETRR